MFSRVGHAPIVVAMLLLLLLLAVTAVRSRNVVDVPDPRKDNAGNEPSLSSTKEPSSRDAETDLGPEDRGRSLRMPISVAVVGSIVFLVCCFCCLRCAVDFDSRRRGGTYASSKSNLAVIRACRQHFGYEERKDPAKSRYPPI